MSATDLEAWSTDIEAELAEVLVDLDAAKIDLTAAQTARDANRAEERRVGAVLDSLAGQNPAERLWGTPQPGLSPFLARHRDAARRAAHDADGNLTMARLRVENLEYRVADAREALATIETAINSAKEDVSNG